jgi:hypothetical protein
MNVYLVDFAPRHGLVEAVDDVLTKTLYVCFVKKPFSYKHGILLKTHC